MSNAQPALLENATRDLARFAAALRFEDLPAEVIERIKLSVLDSLGCCVHGATLPWTRKVAELAQEEGAQPVASIVGMGSKTSIALAALVNGTAGHAFELDDIHKESIVHPGSLATPVALAFAEARGRAPGRDVITGMVAGYEVGARVGNAATMSLFLRGFHPQGTSGTFVAAATAARMLDLDAVQTQHALGIVGSQAGGLMAAQEGAMVKRFHSGRAAQSGVYSALLARRGFTGITDVLEAAYGGFLSSLSDKPAPSRLTAGLGATWETLNVGYKPHASVTSIHTALDALAEIMRENGLHADDIAAVDAGLSHMTHVHCAWDYQAQGVTAAQMNLYYGLAVIALDGAAFVDQYREERLRDPRVLDFIKRIKAHVDPGIEAMGAAFRHAARLKVATRDGRMLEREILHRRGSPENPLKPEDIVYKFRQIVRSCLPQDDIERLVRLAAELDRLESIQELIAIVARPPQRAQ
ncbi:MAG: MmgE/PrpD family protein [Betaproteobacteria bacterium]|nr:MmgE/PrpD family protein [Betaproteobacteria bacterium]